MTSSQPDKGKKGRKEHAWFWDALSEHLQRKNLKQTKQRQVVVATFLGLNDHVAAEELHATLREEGHNIGLATVYRTLHLLAEAGLVDQKQFGESKAVYEVKTPGEHHDHIICIDCGTVIEFENDEIEKLQEKVAKTHQFRLTSHRLDLFGHCLKQNCSNRRS